MKKLLPLLIITFCVIKANAQIIITGYMKNPTGTNYDTTNGSIEYLQLMATEDIVGATNYKVVISAHSNNAKKYSGWVNGTSPFLFSLDIPSLTVNKGDFFYIVGTDINSAKFNGSSSNLFPENVLKYRINVTRELFSNNVTGIAVFDTQTPSTTKRPIDAVFVTTSAFDYMEKDDTQPTNSFGYTLPTYNNNNDALYFNKNDTDGNCIILRGNNDVGRFYKFGGIYNSISKIWTSPRTELGVVSNPNSISDLEGTTTLPVNLKFFASSNSNNQTKLIWNTAEETNFRAFEVEKSEDGINFTIIGSVNGKGSNSNYNFNVTQNQDVAYYRLKLVDYDGDYSYSHIISLNLSLKTDLAIYPNPTSDYLNITANKDSKLKIFSSNGKVVKEFNATKGTNTVDVRDLMVGVYYVYLDGSVFKFIKQ